MNSNSLKNALRHLANFNAMNGPVKVKSRKVMKKRYSSPNLTGRTAKKKEKLVPSAQKESQI